MRDSGAPGKKAAAGGLDKMTVEAADMVAVSGACRHRGESFLKPTPSRLR